MSNIIIRLFPRLSKASNPGYPAKKLWLVRTDRTIVGWEYLSISLSKEQVWVALDFMDILRMQNNRRVHGSHYLKHGSTLDALSAPQYSEVYLESLYLFKTLGEELPSR